MKIKQKTKKAVSKRVIKTGTGELKRKNAYRSHLAHNKTTKAKRHSKKDNLISSSDKNRYDQLI
ncbi:MAG: 50S ribosomal protein L35 [Mycoplasmoidaceae bacterium]